MDHQQRSPGSFASRRRALKSIVTASGAVILAPHEWQAPLVKSVVLPAHAQTSLECNIVTNGMSAGEPCTEVSSGLQLVYAGMLSGASVGSASGQFDADGSRWTFLEFNVNPGDASEFEVLFCFDPTLPEGTQVTITATDDNGNECTTAFILGDVAVPGGP